VKYPFIRDQRRQFPIVKLCAVMQVSTSGFYDWRKRTPSIREQENQRLLLELRLLEVATRHRYGSPRMHRELRDRGWWINRKRVEKLMKTHGIRARRHYRRVCTTRSDPSLPVASNLLNQQFHFEEINRAWVGDVTYIPTREGWLYLAIIMDLCSRKIVGWATGENNDRALARRALAMALRDRLVDGDSLIHHTDRGSPYASGDYTGDLTHHGILPSMSRSGNCYDNAPAESFMSTLKMELVPPEGYSSREEAHRSIFEYIEGFYNTWRKHSSLGYLSPVEYERRLSVQA
jgi:transposase InsO family protein